MKATLPVARVFRRFGPLGLVITVVAACQGASPTDLFDSSKSPEYDGGTTPTEDAGGTSSSSSGEVDSGPIDDGGNPEEDGGNPDDDAGEPDAGPDLDPMHVYCTNDVGYCDDATPQCCGRRNIDGTVRPFSCKAACDGATETVITCDDDQDCTDNRICCIVHNPANGQPLTAQCEATCQPSGNVTRMCDPRRPDPCPAFNDGWLCKPHQGLPGLYACLP